MARARNIKPGFFENELLAECDMATRLLFAGLWTLADREGRLEDRPVRIKMRIFPYDSVSIDGMLGVLQGKGLLRRYRIGATPVVQIERWHDWQNIGDNEPAGHIPDQHGLLPTYAPGQINDGTYRRFRETVLRRHGAACLYCGSAGPLTLDHVIPRSRGGLDIPENLVPACRPCNSSKGARTPSEWRASE